MSCVTSAHSCIEEYWIELWGDGVMETRLPRGKSLVGFDSLPPKDIQAMSVFWRCGEINWYPTISSIGFM